MSNKEIEKQAEELIERHTDYAEGITSTPEETGYHNDGNTLRINSIKAAIVSCKFFLQRIGPNLADFSYEHGLPITPSVHTEVTQIKAYLEGLL